MHVHTVTYHPQMSDSPTWKTLAGTFLHRAVLHPGGKWRYVNTPEKRDEYLEHSRRLAHQLHYALQDENFYLAEALADSGGPSWAKSVNQYRELSPRDKECAISPLLESAETITECILEEAEKNHWLQVRTEVDAPMAHLNGETNTRIDLLVKRERLSPVVVELKTSRYKEPSPDAQKMTEENVASYARMVAKMCQRNVNYQWVWARRSDGTCTWGRQKTVAHARLDY